MVVVYVGQQTATFSANSTFSGLFTNLEGCGAAMSAGTARLAYRLSVDDRLSWFPFSEVYSSQVSTSWLRKVDVAISLGCIALVLDFHWLCSSDIDP